MSKHTPGPWERNEFYIESNTGDIVCEMLFPVESEERYNANAHLITAAPDMFAALKELVHLHLCDMEGMLPVKPEAWTKAVDDAADAIEEATGGRECPST